MLKFLIVHLDDASVSFCHCDNNCRTNRLIPLEILKEAVIWSMKENLTLEFVYPDQKLPDEYKQIIDRTYHADIVPSTCEDENLRNCADAVVFDSWESILSYHLASEQTYILRTDLRDLLEHRDVLASILPKIKRINIVLTDVPQFTKDDEPSYAEFLEYFSSRIGTEHLKGHHLQTNVLTDRIILDKMNNCGAGHESIALCPDGNFYVCPAFYLNGDDSGRIGNVETGLMIKNPQLYKLAYAPICRNCDAWQCKRCIWLNKKMTLEVNTPSHEQCVIAHLERNASRNLLDNLQQKGLFGSIAPIQEVDYLDPFVKIQRQ